MTLPTTSPLNAADDDSDMFGPPRSSPVRHHQRPRVPMISAKLRQREERKRILQLCAHKLERIKDSEANLRRSVCINNTYSRLTDEVRREKQSRYLANLPKQELKPETAHNEMSNGSYHHHHHNQQNMNTTNNSNLHDIYPTNGPMELRNEHLNNNIQHHQNHHHHHHHHHLPQHHHHHQHHIHNSMPSGPLTTASPTTTPATISHNHQPATNNNNNNNNNISNNITNTSSQITSSQPAKKKRSSCSVDTDLEILDRELSAINASMPLSDPEITQGAEQLEKAISSRKRLRAEEDTDRLVREALSQFYLPTQRLISAIDDCPLDIKRTKMCNVVGVGGSIVGSNNSIVIGNNHLHHHHHHHCGSTTNGDLDLDLSIDINHQNQKDFEVIMDALRLGTSSPTSPSPTNDSCGQAAMMSVSGVFHNLVVTSLET